jgi:hypothetical protein
MSDSGYRYRYLKKWCRTHLWWPITEIFTFCNTPPQSILKILHSELCFWPTLCLNSQQWPQVCRSSKYITAVFLLSADFWSPWMACIIIQYSSTTGINHVWKHFFSAAKMCSCLKQWIGVYHHETRIADNHKHIWFFLRLSYKKKYRNLRGRYQIRVRHIKAWESGTPSLKRWMSLFHWYWSINQSH